MADWPLFACPNQQTGMRAHAGIEMIHRSLTMSPIVRASDATSLLALISNISSGKPIKSAFISLSERMARVPHLHPSILGMFKLPADNLGRGNRFFAQMFKNLYTSLPWSI